MAELLKGAPAAAALTEELAARCEALKGQGVEPCLAIVRVGERPDDIAYETGAMKRCEKTGIKVRHYLLAADAGKEEILSVIREINEDSSIHGCLMFRPLADKAAEAEACALLDPEKDADSMTETSIAGVFACTDRGYPPCTAEAVIKLLEYYQIPLEGKRVTVIGRSMVIGKPVSIMLQKKNATVTMCHTRTADLPGTCRNAEILVVAAGKAGVVDETCVSPGQIVIDVGINVGADGKMRGDVDFESVEPIVAAITPVPGGVGSMTTAMLCSHVIRAAEKSLRK